jgi:hypothetical protein
MIKTRLYALFREIIPHSRAKIEVNPPHLFEKYQQQLSVLEKNCDTLSSDQRDHYEKIIWHMFDSDKSRKESMEKRAEILLILNGATITIFLSVISISPFNMSMLWEKIAVAAVIYVALLFSLVSLILSLALFRRIPRHIISFDEVAGSDFLFSRNPHMCLLGQLIIDNWKVNNTWAEKLEVARRYFRNFAIITFAVTTLVASIRIL